MTKKFLSMFLALVMCLSLAATAFAAEEETETTNEPVVQTEVETEATDEAAVQEAGCDHLNYTAERFNEVDPADYDELTHAVHDVETHTCTTCKRLVYRKVWSTQYLAHKFNITKYGSIIGSDGEDVPTYLYECKMCNYIAIRT